MSSSAPTLGAPRVAPVSGRDVPLGTSGREHGHGCRAPDAIVLSDCTIVLLNGVSVKSEEDQYEINAEKNGYLRLKEKLTGSVVRLQTNDKILSETFWNYCHN